MTTRIAARLALSLVTFLVCAELMALGWTYVATGHLFYADSDDGAQEQPAAPDDRLATDFAVHPYFGFAHIPNAGFHDERTELLVRDGWPRAEAAARTNNFGFISPHAYPVTRTSPDQFFVGVFGGSVGMWFCQIGVPRLIEALEQHAFFRSKEIVPLCFAQSGYKQPQQALLLTYFLSIDQPLDLAINIDGFNEVALAALNHDRRADISMPSIQHLGGLINMINQSTLTPEKLASLAAATRDRASLARLDAAMRDNPSAAIHVLLNAYSNRIRARYEQELVRYDSLPSNPEERTLVQVTPPVAERDRAALVSDMAAAWARASILMRDVLAARGGVYLHVLQPNQYYTSRRFTPEEAATALSEASPYKRSVEEAYPALQAAARAMLVENRVPFFDATRLLDNEPSRVYIDDCCHYTLIGNHLLAQFIATSVLSTPGPWGN